MLNHNRTAVVSVLFALLTAVLPGASASAAPRVVSVEPTPGPVLVSGTALNHLVVSLSEPVEAQKGSVRAFGLLEGEYDVAIDFDLGPAAMRLTLSPMPQADIITIVIDQTVVSPEGVALDGEIGDPRSPVFPSGDGNAGGPAVLQYRVLRGDVNGDNVVNAQDLGQILGFWGQSDPLHDLNGDGVVNASDLAILLGNWGMRLPDLPETPVITTSITPTGPIDSDVSQVEVEFSAPINPLAFFPGALHVSALGAGLRVPDSAMLAPDGLSATFTFSPPLPRCDRHRLKLSNALQSPEGALLAPPVMIPTADGVFPPGFPSIDPTPTATAESVVMLSGASANADMVRIASQAGQFEAIVIDGAYAINLPLKANTANHIFVKAVSPCGVESAPATRTVISDQQPPNLFIDFPSDGADIQADITDIAGRVADMHSGFEGLVVTVNGQSAEVDIGIGTNGTFFLPGLVLNTDGPTEIVAVATDAVGNTRTRTISVSRLEIPEGAARMDPISGNGQGAQIAQTLAEPIVVRVLRGDGSPFAGKVVTFNVTRSDGRLAGAPSEAPGAMMFQTVADSQGFARAWWTLGTDAGCGNNRIEVTSRDIAGTVVFCASAAPGPAFQINIGEGNNQRGEAGGPAPFPLRVFVSDSCNGVPGIPVEFSIVRGDGSIDGESSVVVPTGPTGHASVPFMLGQTSGQNRVRATFPGNPNAPAEFVLTGVARDQRPSTTFSGVVLDNASQPIGGVTLRLVVEGEDMGTTISDEEGQFIFVDFPGAGAADLYVDGSTADFLGGPKIGQPIDPFSFPTLHFEPVIIPNASNSLGMPVLLPRMNPNNVRFYSLTEPTILEVEGVEGLRMIVQPGSMTLADGTPAPDGHPMTLNQVHHDNIPMPMPNGAAPPFAWTLGPAEATFDPPITVEYPNMSGLPPGAVAYFLTFDHATGRFEIFSSGSVSEDGSVITTDPGSGLTLAGWGGNCPPYSVTGDACKMRCSNRGQISGGQAQASVVGNTIISSASGVVDTGGQRACDTGQTQSVPADDVIYTYEVFNPAGVRIASGSGASVQVNAELCGVYQILFTASVSRPCAPASRVLSASVLFGEEPSEVDFPSVSRSFTFDGWDLFLIELPAISGKYNTMGKRYKTCCGDLGIGISDRDSDATFEQGQIMIAGDILVPINIPVPAGGPLIRLVDRVVCDRLGSRVPPDLLSCMADISLRADGIMLLAEGAYAASDCPSPDWNITSMSGNLVILNPRLVAALSVTILGETFALAGVGTSSVQGQVSADGKDLLLRIFDQGGRISVAGELPFFGDFELVGIDYPPILDSVFRIRLPNPTDSTRGVFEAIAEPVPQDEWPEEWLPQPPQQVDDRWEVSIAGQMVQAENDAFRITNIAAPDLFGPGGPGSLPDFLSDDCLRVTGTAEIGGKTWYAFSEPFQIRSGETFLISEMTITDVPPPFTESVGLAPDGIVLLKPGQVAQLAVIGTLSDGSEMDLTPRTACTVYRTSNPSIATIGPDGLVTAHSVGTALITAINEAAATTKRVNVVSETTQTTVAGFVQFEDGSPAAGAVVVTALGGQDVTGSDGAFMLTVDVPANATTIGVTAVASVNGENFAAGASVGPVVPGGVTDAGLITLTSGCDELGWIPTFGQTPGVDDAVLALAVFDDGSGAALYVGGGFATAGGVPVNGIARWDGASWSPLGSGVSGGSSPSVSALTVFDDGSGDGPALYAGGLFTTAGGAPANRIAKWNGESWSPLGNGMNNRVTVLTVFDDGSGVGPALYAGGDFTIAGDEQANFIAKWNGESWSPLGSGMGGAIFPSVSALTVFDDGSGAGPALYAGGAFTTAGGVSASRIAKWDGESWSPLGSGFSHTFFNNSWVSALTVFDDGLGAGPALYAGGNFNTADNEQANNIARWDGASWSPLGSGMGGGSSPSVASLTVFDDGSGAGPALYAGGGFSTAGGMTVNRIAKWAGTSWSPLGSGVSVGFLGGLVSALTVFDDGSGDGPVLYVGGYFTMADDKLVNRIARWDGASWSPLGRGMNNSVEALTVFDDGSGDGPVLYASGNFTMADDKIVNRIGRWDGASWSPLGSGMNNTVSALTVFDDGSGDGPALYAGGNFSTAGGMTVNRIAKWNGASWSSLGLGINFPTYALMVFDDGTGDGPALYAGGNFSMAGGVTVNSIAKWDGDLWTPLGSGMNSLVRALAVYDDGSGSGPALYAGGLFTSAGGVTVNGIAKWDGASWSPLGSGVSGGSFPSVRALTVFDDGSGDGPALYAGGLFTTAGGAPANRIAKWNGESWSPLGSGIGGSVNALTVFDDGSGAGPALYVGGGFTTAGGVPANRIAKWNGKFWSALNEGVSDSVLALRGPELIVNGAPTGESFDDGSGPALYIGGFFNALPAGDAFLAKWGCAPQQSAATLLARGDLSQRPSAPQWSHSQLTTDTTRSRAAPCANCPDSTAAKQASTPDHGATAQGGVQRASSIALSATPASSLDAADAADGIAADSEPGADAAASDAHRLVRIEDLGPPEAAPAFDERTENLRGQITGAEPNATGAPIAYRAEAGGERRILGALDVLEAAATLGVDDALALEALLPASRGLSIADDGRIVGVSGAMFAAKPQGAATDEPRVALARAFLWTEDRGMIDLNDLLPAESAWTLEAAVAFDDAGRVIGLGVHQGQPRAFRMTLPAALTPRPRIVGDVTGDGAVGMSDLHALLSAWGSNDPRADLNSDGVVDSRDLNMLMQALGTAAP